MSSGLEAYLETEDQDSRELRIRGLRRMLGLIAEHRKPFVGGLAMVLLGTFAALLEPRLFGYAIDDAIIPKRWDLVVSFGVALFGVISVRVVAAISQAYLFEVLGQRVTQKLRVQLFSHLQRLPVSVYDKHAAGRLLTRVTNDVASLNEMFSAGFATMLSNALMVLGILIWLLVLNLKLGLIATSVFPLLVLSSMYFSRRLRTAYRESRSKLSALNAFLAENLNGMKVVQLFNREKLHIERFERVNHWYAEALISTVRVFAVFQPTITVSAGIALAMVIGFGGQMVLDQEIKPGVLVAAFSYSLALFQPVREIADKWNIFLSGMISAERIFAILDWKAELIAQDVETPAQPLAGIRGHVVFENVWFAYDSSSEPAWVLKDFSFEILPGQTVGIVGHTGAGKTTLIGLLTRFYEPQRGRIVLDGKDLREYDRRSLRASFGIIQQDAFVFSGTFRDNISFWQQNENAGTQAALATLRELGYEKWWRSDTPDLRERGSNLSMGEKQVLAFTRAIAAQPSVWILDEATANMDSQTEEKLQSALSQVTMGKTSILVAHRLATIRAADLILVLHKGSLVEAGQHAALVQRDGLYARLYRYQQAQG